VIPDYLFDGKGMRIDGVTEGKPAEKAGIIKGDVVVKMGEIDIVDMMSYMTGLSKFEKGSSTTVKVLRDGNIVEVDVTF
jgi:S1-C subfamily serine protease